MLYSRSFGSSMHEPPIVLAKHHTPGPPGAPFAWSMSPIHSSPVWTCEKPVSWCQDATQVHTRNSQTLRFLTLPALPRNRVDRITPRTQQCHTASYMFFIVNPDICSHTRDLAYGGSAYTSKKHAMIMQHARAISPTAAHSRPHHHKSLIKATKRPAIAPHKI